MKLSRRAVVVGTLGFVLAAIVLMPMRVAFGALGLDRAGVTASAIHGTIWSGRLEQLHIGRVNLGTLDAALSPVQLLLGRARIALSRHNGTPDDLVGTISTRRGSIAIEDATGAVPMAGQLATLPISAIELEGVTVRFTDGNCEVARGTVRARISLIGEALTGGVQCDGSRALLRFGTPGAPARLELRFAADGAYAGTLVLDGKAGAALSALGFARAPDGYRVEINGRLR